MCADFTRQYDKILKGLDISRIPEYVEDGFLSYVQSMVPSVRGGYSLAPILSSFWSVPTGETVIGASQVGMITASTPQITVATTKPSINALYQYKVIAAGSGSQWGMLFGSSQDYSRDRIVYHRKDLREYTLGWDPDAYDYHCHLFDSFYQPVGVEPMDQSGVSAAATYDTSYHLAVGWVRIYLVWEGDFTEPSASVSRVGAPDLVNHIDIEIEEQGGVLGSFKKGRIGLTDLPTAVWPTTDVLYIYATRVVDNQAQLEFEAAYLYGDTRDLVNPYYLSYTNSNITETGRAQLEAGKFDFPTVGESDKFEANLMMEEHLGHLLITGVEHTNRLLISGYVDNDLAIQNDTDWWGFFIDIPDGEEIRSFGRVNNKLIVLSDQKVYTVDDEDTNPNNWILQPRIQLKTDSIDSITRCLDSLFFISSALKDVHNVFSFDGYNMERVGDEIAREMTSSARVISMGTEVVTVGDATCNGYVRGALKVWGKQNLDTATGAIKGLGSNSLFASNAPLLLDTAGIKYFGAAYPENSAVAYLESRRFYKVREERSEWSTLFLLGSGSEVTVEVGFIADGVTHAALLTQVIDSTDPEMYRIGIPNDVRHARVMQVLIGFPGAAAVTIYSIGLQFATKPER